MACLGYTKENDYIYESLLVLLALSIKDDNVKEIMD